MYTIINSSKIDFVFKKLARKNPKQLEIIINKLDEIAENPHRFKPLRNIMKVSEEFISAVLFLFTLLMKTIRLSCLKITITTTIFIETDKSIPKI